MYERPGYRTLIGRLRDNVRTYIRKQLELPRQEIAEIVRANLGAAKWFGVAFAFALAFLIALVVLIIALVALVLPLWASALVIAAVMAVGAGVPRDVGYKRPQPPRPPPPLQTAEETVPRGETRLLRPSAG